MIKYLETVTVLILENRRKIIFEYIDSARSFAEQYVGNTATKPFPDEETYIYGPGNG